MISCALALMRRVALGAPHHDAVGALLDDVHVEVGVGLRVRCQRAVALHVGLRHRHREVAVAAVLVERPRPLERLALEDAQQRRTARRNRSP